MSNQIHAEIYIGNNSAIYQLCPSLISGSTPIVKWELPSNINQKRYNLRITSVYGTPYYVSGERSTPLQQFQWPHGTPMNDNWLGLCHIEIIISEDATIGKPFEYTTGDVSSDKSSFFVYDTSSEQIYNSSIAILKWQNVYDINYGQQLSYKIQVSENPLFPANDIFHEITVNANTGFYTDTSINVDNKKTYFWRVRTFDGLDYGDWSKVNGFFTILNTPPTIEIIEVIPLNNDYGDVYIKFRTNDVEETYTSVICEYSGGTSGINKSPCSLISSTNQLTNGEHVIYWRSSRDEQRIQSSDYIIWMRAYDGFSISDEVHSDTFSLDNRRFGIPDGGFGAVDVEYRCEGHITNFIENDYKPGHVYPLLGYIDFVFLYDYLGWDSFNNDPWGKSYFEQDPSNPPPIPVPYPKPAPNPNFSRIETPVLLSYIYYINGRNMSYEDKQFPHSYYPPYNVHTSFDPNFATNAYGQCTSYLGIGGNLNPGDLFNGQVWNMRSEIGTSRTYKYYYQFSHSFNLETEDNHAAPRYTWNPDLLKSDGYPYPIPESDWWLSDTEQVYMKVYDIEMSYPQPATIPVNYGYKNWKPILKNGLWVKETRSYGLRGEAPTIVYDGGVPKFSFNGVVADHTVSSFWHYYIYPKPIGVPVYIPIQQGIHHPDKPLSRQGVKITGKLHENGKWQYVLGSHDEGWQMNGSEVWGWDSSMTKLGLVQERAEPIMTGKLAVKTESSFTPGPMYPLHGSFTYWLRYLSDKNRYSTISERFPDLDFRILGNLAELYEYYFSGQPKDENIGYAGRKDPPYRYDRGFDILGNLYKPQKVRSLAIVYLQSIWDAYNTIHWTATLGYTTKTQLQYAEYENNILGEWKDALVKGGKYDGDYNAYLIEPLVWDAFLETIDDTVFKEGYKYKFRIRLIDTMTNTYTSWVYSNNFIIEHDAVNPVNITNIQYEPWNKLLYITFRVDDTQGDLYDITGMDYTADGRTWFPIKINDIKGHKTNLESNIHGDNTDKIITHQIYWNIRDYDMQAGNSYRVRIHATYSLFRENTDKPDFAWSMWNNPLFHKGNGIVRRILGYTQYYYWDNADEEWKKSDTPIPVAGELQRVEWAIEDIKKNPPPNGITEFYANHDENDTLLDPTGLNNWLQTDIGGVTREEKLRGLEEKKEQLNIELTLGYQCRLEGEMLTRRNCVRQGFYNNGFIDNNTSNDYFRFRVENQPYLPYSNPNEIYNERWEVYYELQMGVVSTYDSQAGGKPLRQFLYNSKGERLQGGKISDNTVSNYDHIYDPLPQESTLADENRQNGESLEQDKDQNGDVNDTPVYYDIPTDKQEPQGKGDYKLQDNEYPGKRENYYINDSYPEVDDILPPNVSDWNRDYYWRVRAYNLIDENAREISQSLITEVSVGSVDLIVRFLSTANDQVEKLKHSYNQDGGGHWGYDNYWISLQSKTPAWENVETLSFPTDRPLSGGQLIESDNYENPWIPSTFDRSRPWVVKDENYNYQLFYHKSNIYGKTIITHSMGKGYGVFGEYAQCFPYFTTDTLSDYGHAEQFYAPTVVQDGNYYHMWCNGVTGTQQSIYHTKTYNTFYKWDEVVKCEGLDGFYYPSVIYDGTSMSMWCCKVHNGLSSIFLFTSVDGVEWNIENNGNPVYVLAGKNINSPCVIINNDNTYTMYFTEYLTGGDSIISSVKSTDGLAWGSYRVEIDETEAVYHPCVIKDRFMGNEEWRIYYNNNTGVDMILKTAVLTDRVWQYGNRTAMTTDNNFPCSTQGKSYVININIDDNGLVITNPDDVKVRLDLLNTQHTKTYRVESDWVSVENADFINAVLTPNNKWRLLEDV